MSKATSNITTAMNFHATLSYPLKATPSQWPHQKDSYNTTQPKPLYESNSIEAATSKWLHHVKSFEATLSIELAKGDIPHQSSSDL